MSIKNVVTITGIRPDFIRMRNVFRCLDRDFNHLMVHTGQHYDDSLSKLFFDELNIRKPDYVLNTGQSSRTHYEQMSYLSKEIFYLFNREKIQPDIILFLGDSNSALVSVVLFKEGYRIGHIEAGMRSHDRRMPEEVNRVTCDYVSDCHFVYTPRYKDILVKEGRPAARVFVVGNTITEIVREYMPKGSRRRDCIVADIHRSENLKTPEQYRSILTFLDTLGRKYNLPVKLAKFNRAYRMIQEHDLLRGLENIEVAGPYSFVSYLELQYHALFVVSDSGTVQEEGPLLGVPVIVPRRATERPESVENGNSILVGDDRPIEEMIEKSAKFISAYSISDEKVRWLGDGTTSERISKTLKEI